MRITITRDELSNPKEFDELSIELVGQVRGTISKTGDILSIDGLSMREANITLKSIKPYLDTD